MQITRTLCAGLLLAALGCVPALAQMYPGADVSVNPGATGRSYLLYPGGRYGRQVGHLLQPGERPGARIHLHYPIPHRVAKTVVHRATRVATLAPVTPPPKPMVHPPVTTDLNALPEDSATRLVSPSTVAPVTAKPTKPAPTPTRAATAAPPPDTGATMIPFTFGSRTPAPHTAPAMVPPRAAPATPPPTRVARTTPAPATTVPSLAVASGMKKESTILFAAGESTPSGGDVHALAGSLNAALSAGATRIQLDAFGGPRGDKSSDSRRLSLKRALVVRELLIQDGVPSEKIDVRAMGGVDDNGVADRVDVFVRA